MAGLRVVRLLGSDTIDDRGVGLSLLGEDNKRYDLDIDGVTAPIVAAAILRHAGELQSKRHPDDPQDALILQGTALQGAVLSTGNVGLVLTLEGGAELVFSLPSDSIGPVADMLRELIPATQRH